jgi:hypothetical protein
MDQDARARIRSSARILHVIGQLMLLMLLVTSVMWWYVGRSLGKRYVASVFTTANESFLRSQKIYQDQKLEAISDFLPPSDPDSLKPWAERIQRHMGQYVTIFLQRGSEVQWVLRSDSLGAVTAMLTQTLSRHTYGGTTDTVGSMRFQRFYTHGSDSSRGRAVFVTGPLNDSMQWGLVYGIEDSWQRYLKMLDGAKPNPDLEPAVAGARYSVFLGSNPAAATHIPRLRAVFRGQEIFRSPDLDLKQPSQNTVLPGVVLEYYLSPEAALNARMLADAAPLWARWGLTLGVMVILFLNYLWIKSLTAPELSDQS